MNEHVNDYTLIRFEIRIVAADSIRDSIRTKISDSQVPSDDWLQNVVLVYQIVWRHS